MKLAATASRRERALVANSSENRTVLEANVGSATPVRNGRSSKRDERLAARLLFRWRFPGDFFQPSPVITVDYLRSALMCLSLGQIGTAAPRRYQSRAIPRTEESNRAARQTERFLCQTEKTTSASSPSATRARCVKVWQATARGKGCCDERRRCRHFQTFDPNTRAQTSEARQMSAVSAGD
jgi:hypothetical protein